MSSSTTGLVTFRLDPKNPPKLTAEEQEAWDSLANLRDEDIDFSDIPDQSGTTGWRRVSDLVPVQNKQQITLRLDPDVIGWFKRGGRGYQSRMGAVLRSYVEAKRKRSA